MATNQYDFSGWYDSNTEVGTEERYDFSDWYDSDKEVITKPKSEPIVQDPDVEVTMDDLDKRADWLQQARIIYNHENPDEKFKGTDKKLSEWFKDRHSSLNHNLTDLISTGFDTSEMSDEVKRAWSQSMDTYEKTDSDFATFARAVKNTFADPATYAGLFGTMGLGLIAKVGAKKGASKALRDLLGRFEFKNQLEKQLTTQVGKEAAEEFVKTGAGKVVTKEVLKEARKNAAKEVGKATTYSGMASGAGWGAGFGIGEEQFEVGIEKKDSADLLNIAQATIAGTVGLGAFGRYLPRVTEKVMRNRALRKLADNPTPVEKKDKIIETGIFKNSDDSQFDNNILSRSIENDNELAVGGIVEIKTDKALTVSQIKRLKETYELSNISIEPVGKSRKNFIGTKIQESKEIVAGDLPTGRSTFNKFIAKFKSEVYDDRGVGDLFKAAQQELTSTVRVTERNIDQNFKKLVRAIKKDYKIKNFKDVDDKELRLINEVLDEILKGNSAALQSLQARGLTNTINQLELMRNNIKDLQQEMLDSGVIDVTTETGKELSAKIIKSKDGSEEFYITRQYEAFDNPDWKSTLQRRDGGQQIINSAKSFIYKDLVKNYNNWIDNVENPRREAKWAEDTAEGIGDPKGPNLLGTTGPKYEQKLAEIDKEADNVLNELLTRKNSDDVLTILNEATLKQPSVGKAGRVLGRRKDVPDQIRAVLGEYKDPFTNYANTVQNLSRLNAQFKYEKRVAELIDAAQAGGEGIKGAAKIADSIGDPDMKVLLTGAFPEKAGDQRSFMKKIESVFKTGADENMSPEEIRLRLEEVAKKEAEAGIVKPLLGYRAYPEVADAIEVGNELRGTSNAMWARYLTFQGYARATKTVYSPSAIARNFMGSGMMALGAGYLRPSKIRGMMDVAKGLVDDAKWNKTNPEAAKEETEKMITKGLHLNFIQSGLDFNAFRGALNDAGKKDFYNFESPLYKGGLEAKKNLKKFNTSAVKLYQAMDDVWKQFAFLNEQDMLKQTLLDQGIDPNKIVRTIKTPNGLDVPITELDLKAAQRVNEHMQNYSNVPRFVKQFRKLPLADFLAFKTEVARTSKNIIKNAVNDIREGSQRMKAGEEAVDIDGNLTGKLKGQHQRNEGLRRLGAAISTISAVPAIATTSAVVMLGGDEEVEGTGYSRDEGLERILRTDWNPGHHFYYFGTPENGKGRRINLSYINPWASGDELITAAGRALKSGENVDGALTKAAVDGIIRPIGSALGPSMVAKVAYNLGRNEDDYGNTLFKSKDNVSDWIVNVVSEIYKAFEPGGLKTIGNTYDSLQGDYPKEFSAKEGFILPKDWDNAPIFSDQYGIRKGKTGTRLYAQDQITSFFGIKPETYNIDTIFPLKLKSLERERRDTIKTFKEVYQDQGIFTPEDLIESYKKSLANNYSYAKDIYDLVQQYKAGAATERKDGTLKPASSSKIRNVITKNGLFKDRYNKKLLGQVLDNKYIPPSINYRDLQLWAAYTKEQTGILPPIDETWNSLKQINDSYYSESLGKKAEVKMKSGGSIFDNLFATRPNINRDRKSMRKGLDIVGESLGLEKYHVGDGDDTEAYVPEVIGDDTEAVGDINNIIFNNFERLGINPDNYGIAKNNLIDFATRTKMAESSGDYKAVNIPEKGKKKTTAKGAYQFIDGSVLPALKRLEVRIGKRDWIDRAKQHKDIFKLTPLQQDALFLGDIMEKTIKKTQGLGDKYIKRILKGDVKAMKDLYRIGHHTVGRKGMSPAARKNMNYWFQ